MLHAMDFSWSVDTQHYMYLIRMIVETGIRILSVSTKIVDIRKYLSTDLYAHTSAYITRHITM